MDVLTLLAGALAGLVLGLTGAGGSVLAIPLLVYVLGWSFVDAVPVALLAVSVAAATGAALAWNSGLVRWRAALVLAGFGALTTAAGLATAARLPATWLLAAFAVVTAIVAWRMWRQARIEPAAAGVVRAGLGVRDDGSRIACAVDPDTGRLRWNARCFSVIAATGALTGYLGGALGVGGGFVIVPALRARTGLGMHAAVATSLLAIALTSAAGVVAAGFAGRFPPLPVAAPFVLGALAGMVAGRFIAPRIAGAALQKFFAVTMLAVAIGMAFDALLS
ncbi:MAG: sulfite exporter TauE/SafE family protein [Pseudomonadota bacterium]